MSTSKWTWGVFAVALIFIAFACRVRLAENSLSAEGSLELRSCYLFRDGIAMDGNAFIDSSTAVRFYRESFERLKAELEESRDGRILAGKGSDHVKLEAEYSRRLNAEIVCTKQLFSHYGAMR